MKNKRYMRNYLTGVPAVLCAALAFAAQFLFGSASLLAAANTYDAAVQTVPTSVRRTNDAAVTARHLLWREGATAGETCALNSATTIPLGTIDNTETSTGIGMTVLLLGKGDTKKMVANAAITAGSRVYAAADGKVAPSGTILVGIALSAASADDDIIHVRDCAPVVLAETETVTATNVITASESGKIFFLNSATEFVSTLPAPVAGMRFRFVVTGAPSGASYTIVTASSANLIVGSFASAADAGGSMDSETTGGDTITFVDGQAVVGDWVEVISDGTNWFATGIAADEDAITITTAS